MERSQSDLGIDAFGSLDIECTALPSNGAASSDDKIAVPIRVRPEGK